MKKRLHPALCVLAGIVTPMAFMTVGGGGFTAYSAAPAATTDYIWGFMAVFCAALYIWVYGSRKGSGFSPVAAVFALLFGLFNYLGVTLFYYDTLSHILQSRARCLLAAAQIAGQAALMYTLFIALFRALDGGAIPRLGTPCHGFISRALESRPALFSLAVMLLCWLPYLVCFFPGSVDWDMGHMIGQFYGVYERDTWHPVLTTFICGGCVSLGRLLGSDNIGIFLFTLLQTLASAGAYALTVKGVGELGGGRLAQLAALAFFALTPAFGGFAQMVGKDTIYIGCLTLFALRTALIVANPEKYLARPAHYALYALLALLTCLLRTNGIYVALPTALLTALFAAGRGRAVYLSGALAVAFAAVFAWNGLLLPYLGIKDSTASGIYSICFQSTARYLRDHPEDVTGEEMSEIDIVLDSGAIADKYEPLISDPVKFTYKYFGEGPGVEKPILSRYMRTWLDMGRRHPETYFEAFIAGSSGYYAFIPKLEAVVYNSQTGGRLQFDTDYVGNDPRLLVTKPIEALSGARKLLAIYARGWRHIPLLGLLYACPPYTWLLIALFAYALRKKRARCLIAFAPAALTLAVCCLSPVNDLMRYFMPLMTMTPTLFALTAGGGSSIRYREARASRGSC